MENFIYSVPTEIYFGSGQLNVLGRRIKKLGATKILICFGSERIKTSGLLDEIIGQLNNQGISNALLPGIQPNPRIDSVREGIKICRRENIDLILAVGGGSVIDCAKIIAAGFYHDGDPWDFFIRQARIEAALPVGSVLTLAATGSEMNCSAVISNPETSEKLPIGSPLLRPVFSILDPELTFSVPPYHTAAGVVDIMSHVFEQYFSPAQGTYLNDRMCEAIIKTCIYYGPRAVAQGDDYEARANLLWAGSLALNDLLEMGTGGGDWAVHMIEHEVSAIYDTSHGAGLAIIYPTWMEHVLSDDNVEKFYNLAVNVWNIQGKDRMDVARKGILTLREFFTSIGMPSRLRDVGVEGPRINEMAEKATAWGDLGTFQTLDAGEIAKILRLAY